MSLRCLITSSSSSVFSLFWRPDELGSALLSVLVTCACSSDIVQKDRMSAGTQWGDSRRVGNPRQMVRRKWHWKHWPATTHSRPTRGEGTKLTGAAKLCEVGCEEEVNLWRSTDLAAGSAHKSSTFFCNSSASCGTGGSCY